MPHTGTITFANGTTGELAMPDLYAVLAAGNVADPSIAAVLQLLEGTGALETQNLLQRLTNQKSYWLGLYRLAALCLTKPILRLDVSAEKPLKDGEISPRDLTLNDVQGIYYSFFLGKVALVVHAPDPAVADGAPDPAHTGNGVPGAAKPDRGRV